MARPKKTGLDYFSMDVDVVQDIKVRKLLKYKGGARALGVFTYILCEVYKNGYYLDYNEDTVFIIAENLYEEEAYVMDLVNYCLDIGLFDAEMCHKDHVLTSHGIQMRYLEVQAHFKRSSTIDKYNLISTEELTDNVSSVKTMVSSEETPVNSEETIISERKEEKNIGLFRDSSQNGTQKRKEKKIEKKINIIPTTTSPAREGEFLSGDSEQEDGIDGDIAILLGDEEWLINTASYTEVRQEEIPSLLERFRSLCIANGKDEHKDLSDLKQHFTSWVQKQKEHQNNSNTSQYGKSGQYSASAANDRRRGAPVPVGASQSDFGGEF